ncbi:hexitol phosphatase HxpB [Shewanella maritima]|uniref:hexitol phosphatase HxpB n=1 Tax=Shewanella maritima TaxID=2520507 RepID=UPI003735D5DA
MNIQAVLFDMDGVLIDSEPAWQKAELEVFNQLGLNLTQTDVEQTIGLRIDLVVDYWYKRRPWPKYDNAQTTQAIAEKVVAFILKEGQALPGILDAISLCKSFGLKVGLATSSPHYIIDAVLNRLALNNAFDAIESAEHLALGKPHPEVYLNCAKALAVAAEHCLAIEDSFNGLVAARAASMQTIAIPEAKFANDAKWVIAHHQLTDATEFGQVLNQYQLD